MVEYWSIRDIISKITPQTIKSGDVYLYDSGHAISYLKVESCDDKSVYCWWVDANHKRFSSVKYPFYMSKLNFDYNVKKEIFIKQI